MRLHVLQAHALGRRHAGDRGDLVEDEILRLAGRDVQLAPAEADEIRKPRMRADGHAAFLREPDCLAQHRWIAGVKAGGNVGRRDRRHQGGVVADRVRAEGLAQV